MSEREPTVDPEVPEPASEQVPAALPLPEESDDFDEQDTPYQAAPPVSWLAYVFFLGLFLLIVGVVWWRVELEITPLLICWLFVSSVAVLAPLAWHAVDLFAALASRRGAAFGLVVMTVVLGGVILGAVSAGNVLYLRKRLVWDATETGRHTLGDAAKKLLADVKGTLYVTYLEYNAEPRLRADAQAQLERFRDASQRFELQFLDAVRYKEVAREHLKEWGQDGAPLDESTDTIVISYAEPGKEIAKGKLKVLPVEEFEWRKHNALGDAVWYGERKIADAVLELVYQRKKAYVTGGHGEDTFIEKFRKLRERLAGQNVELSSNVLQLASTPSVPNDCDLLFVLNPKARFAPEEAQAIENWLDRGGRLFLTVDIVEEPTELGLERLLASYGLFLRLHYLVYAPQPEFTSSGGLNITGYIPQSLADPKFDYGEHPASAALRSGGGYPTVYTLPTFIEIGENPPPGVNPEVVIFAPDRSFDPRVGDKGRSFGADVSGGRGKVTAPGPRDIAHAKLPLVVTSTKELRSSPGEPERSARIVVAGDTDWILDRSLREGGREPNLDLAVGLVQWALHREGLVSVSEATISDPVVNMRTDPRWRRLALWWPMGMSLLPLVLGAAVWWSRRR